jgi:hypothetical protein
MRVRSTFSLLLFGASALGAQGVRVNFEAYGEPVLMDTLRQNYVIKATPAKVYEAALKAFADLDIPVGNTVGTEGLIGSERFHRMHAFAGDLLSKSFDCGDDPTGPSANSQRVEIAVVAYIAPAPSGETGTRLGVSIVAQGREVAGPRRAPRPCASTGALERKLRNKIQQLAGA